MWTAASEAFEKGTGKGWVISLQYYGESHVGLRRKNNQDSFCILENGHHAILAVVCDGIGGGNAGDIASHMCVEHMKERFITAEAFENDQVVKKWLHEVVQEANDLVFTSSANHIEYKGMGTTVVGVLQVIDRTYIFNAGDSRTYGLYQDDFICLTEDHSYVADLLKRGEVSEEEASHHPNRNMLTNALGIWNTMRLDIHKIKEDYQSLLICSDGLHGYVEETRIQEVLKRKEGVQQNVHQLIQMSLDAGGFDNVTVIVLKRGDLNE